MFLHGRGVMQVAENTVWLSCGTFYKSTLRLLHSWVHAFASLYIVYTTVVMRSSGLC
jgi:hypothetical protein